MDDRKEIAKLKRRFKSLGVRCIDTVAYTYYSGEYAEVCDAKRDNELFNGKVALVIPFELHSGNVYSRKSASEILEGKVKNPITFSDVYLDCGIHGTLVLFNKNDFINGTDMSDFSDPDKYRITKFR